MTLPDIYFTEAYGKIYEKNGEGKLTTFSFKCDYGKVHYTFLLRKILSAKNNFYDITTPFGYSGPLPMDYKKDELPKLILAFKDSFEAYCLENNIVTEFIRFHPLIKNHLHMELYTDIQYIRDTVYMELYSADDLWKNIKSKCRNMIRKAQKNEVTIQIDNSTESLWRLMDLYLDTMRKNGVSDYYFFDRAFFYNTFQLLKNHIYIFNAIYEEKVISSALIMKYGDYIHYHFSGSDSTFKHLAPNNLLLYEVALWGLENNCKYFHLGGGYSNDDDPLLKFKKSFSKDGLENFYIGKKVHNEAVYKDLINTWQKNNPTMNMDTIDYFPIYRIR